jgi:hypothetical protein
MAPVSLICVNLPMSIAISSVMIAPNLACDVMKSTGLTKSVKRALELTTAIFHGIQAGLMVALSLRLVCCSWMPS